MKVRQEELIEEIQKALDTLLIAIIFCGSVLLAGGCTVSYPMPSRIITEIPRFEIHVYDKNDPFWKEVHGDGWSSSDGKVAVKGVLVNGRYAIEPGDT